LKALKESRIQNEEERKTEGKDRDTHATVYFHFFYLQTHSFDASLDLQ